MVFTRSLIFICLFTRSFTCSSVYLWMFTRGSLLKRFFLSEHGFLIPVATFVFLCQDSFLWARPSVYKAVYKAAVILTMKYGTLRRTQSDDIDFDVYRLLAARATAASAVPPINRYVSVSLWLAIAVQFTKLQVQYTGSLTKWIQDKNSTIEVWYNL